MAKQGTSARCAEPDTGARAPETACLVPFHSSSFHDFGGPINQISTLVELFDRKYQGSMDAEARDILGLIRSAADRLQNRWQGLQVYARSPNSNESHRRCDANMLLADATARLERAIRESDACISSDSLPAITCDPAQVVCLFHHLIENSIKFRSASRPEIRISAARMQDRWAFSFRDNGIGIAPKDRELVFHLFKRLHGDQYPGAGVGLAIVRRILEGHGGRVWIGSEPGDGIEFLFTLPPAD